MAPFWGEIRSSSSHLREVLPQPGQRLRPPSPPGDPGAEPLISSRARTAHEEDERRSWPLLRTPGSGQFAGDTTPWGPLIALWGPPTARLPTPL
jgi:hypothetical protein